MNRAITPTQAQLQAIPDFVYDAFNTLITANLRQCEDGQIAIFNQSDVIDLIVNSPKARADVMVELSAAKYEILAQIVGAYEGKIGSTATADDCAAISTKLQQAIDNLEAASADRDEHIDALFQETIGMAIHEHGWLFVDAAYQEAGWTVEYQGDVDDDTVSPTYAFFTRTA